MAMETETAAATRVTPWEVKERMDRGEPLWFVDARNPQAWSQATEKLPGAIRVPADEVAKHVGFLPGTARSSPTAPESTRPRAPVWRRS